MDMQKAFIEAIPATAAAIVDRVAAAIRTAREKHIPVIYVVVGFRKGTPEISVRNKGFSRLAATGLWDADAGRKETDIHPDLAPRPDEVIVTKRRISAFTGSDLEVVLRAMNITHLILTGIATSGVVLSTQREAADKDYQLTVISDCCADRDEEVHRVLTEKVLPRQGMVTTLADWRQLL